MVNATLEHAEKLHNMRATREEVLSRIEAAESLEIPPKPRFDPLRRIVFGIGVVAQKECARKGGRLFT